MIRKLGLALALYLGAASPLLFVAFRQITAFRVELGALDESFRGGGDTAWSRGYIDSGPYRVRRGERRMTTFVARAALQNARIVVPAQFDRGDVELALRAHRYGQPGVVQVLANGAHVGSLVFEADSYPWDVRRLQVPEAIARRAPMEIELLGEEVLPRVDLPPGTTVALDWVEIRPLDAGAHFVPGRSQWFFALLLPALVFLSAVWSGMRFFAAAVPAGASLGVIALSYVGAPAETATSLAHLWLVFPLGALAYLAMRLGLGVAKSRARKLSTAFALLLLAHSTILFFPNHHPPDLKPHLGQVARLQTLHWEFWDFASTTSRPGHLKPSSDFAQPYVAPYPPWMYFAVHGLRRLIDHPRFWLEFLAMICSATITLLTYGIAREVSRAEAAAPLAFALIALDVSTWHHAARAHTPSVFGQVCFLSAVAYLIRARTDLSSGRLAWITLFSFLASVSYPGALIHWVLLLGALVAFDLVSRRSLAPSSEMVRIVFAAAAGGLLAFVAFYRHFVGTTLSGADAALSRGEEYQLHSSFWFLRNQLRDMARILSFGYPFWVLLALPALARARAWSKSDFARKLVLAWTLSFVVHLVLKDPLFLPQVFLYVKEALMFAPLASVAGGMTLAALAARGAGGKALVAASLLLCFVFQARDYIYNADTVAASVLDAP